MVWSTAHPRPEGLDQGPGALTIVLRHTPSLAWDLGESRGTVAVRMPLHPVAIELLTQTSPLAVSSANRTGLPPAVTADDAQLQLGGAAAMEPFALQGLAERGIDGTEWRARELDAQMVAAADLVLAAAGPRRMLK